MFILVYSIDNRDSFLEVKNLQEQIFATKAADQHHHHHKSGGGTSSTASSGAAGSTSAYDRPRTSGLGAPTATIGWRRAGRHKPYVPMVIVGNKCELNRGSGGAIRAVETWELLKMADGRPSCGCLEASAKRNVNIEEIFLKLFMLARLPTEMTPSLHRKVRLLLTFISSAASVLSSGMRITCGVGMGRLAEVQGADDIAPEIIWKIYIVSKLEGDISG